MRREDGWNEKGGRRRGRGGYTPRLRSPVGFRKRNRLTGLVWVALIFLFIYRFCLPGHYKHDQGGGDDEEEEELSAQESLSGLQTPCPEQSPLARDMLVVLRTGATEALEKLPVHFQTTLRCVPDYIVYSDLDEEIAGHRVHDVFEGEAIIERLRSSASAAQEFQLYEELRSQGRRGIKNISSISTAGQHVGSGPSGALENPAWKLDRFKFLPMVDKALKYRPHAKWFVFVEADTYLVWHNLVTYLSLFNASHPLYIGKHMYIGDVLFAHGGSGFALSNPAMRRVVQQRDTHLAFYDDYTAQNWAGDMVLGKILADVGVSLSWAFPHFQGDPVHALDGNVTKIERRPWCHAPVTYHHMREHEIRRLWEFEMGRVVPRRERQHQRQWRRKRRGEDEARMPLRHADVFKEFVLPQLRLKAEGWDNFSLDVVEAHVASFEACKATCETDPACLQFSYSTTSSAGATTAASEVGKCATSMRVVLGEAASKQCVEYSNAASKCIRWQNDGGDGEQITGSIQSGWMLHRMRRYIEDMDNMCDQGEWVV
jgi:hypothetical protein